MAGSTTIAAIAAIAGLPAACGFVADVIHVVVVNRTFQVGCRRHRGVIGVVGLGCSRRTAGHGSSAALIGMDTVVAIVIGAVVAIVVGTVVAVVVGTVVVATVVAVVDIRR
ncbi:MAG: hypothetical protein Q7T90_09820 [Thiobacillus sp.]|nr:hypothetical protein [Thiobacillus sp.]